MHMKSALAALSFSLVCLAPQVTFADTITLTSATGVSIDGTNVFPYIFTLTGPRINFAVWKTMDPGTPNASHSSYNNAGAFDATAQALATQAAFQATVLPASYYLSDLALLPNAAGSSTWTDGQPQIFMVDPPSPRVTPEPSGLILFGTAMFIGVAFLQATIART